MLLSIWMALLNLFLKILKLIFNKFLIYFLVCTSALSADVLSYFNPNYSDSKYIYSFNASIASDPVSIKSFFNNWRGDFHPHDKNNIALESSRFDIGVLAQKNYYLGYTYRHDVFMEASNDLTHLLYLTKNKKALPLNKEFNLYLSIKGLEAQGIVIGKKFILDTVNFGTLSVFLGTSLLYAKNMQEGVLTGRANIVSKYDYNFKTKTNYFYTHNYLYDLDVAKANGFGFSTHLIIGYKYKKFSMLLVANDILGKIYWNNLPYSYVFMNSKNKYYDKNGYAQYNPTIYGMENSKNYVQRLSRKLYFEGRYKISSKYIFGLGFEYTNGYYFPFSKFTYTVGKDRSYFISHEYRFNSTTIGTNYKNLNFSISADKIFKPSRLGVKLSASIYF